MGIFLSQENGFLTLCVHYPGAPSIFYSIPSAVCMRAWRVWLTGGAGGSDSVMAMGPLVREGEGEEEGNGLGRPLWE